MWISLGFRMNYFQRKRFMKSAWLSHFTFLQPGSVIIGAQARRRLPGESVLAVELEAMGLQSAEVQPAEPAPGPVRQEQMLPPPPPEPEVPCVNPAMALILGYNPVK